ncbi:MAG: hypothetical protein AB8H79_20295 [Myxococcota bacterium]
MRLPRSSMQLNNSLTLSRLSTVKWQMRRTERVATTLIEIAKPSDGPSEWNEIHNLAAASDDQAVFRRNTEAALTSLDTADQSLAEAADLFKRAQELTIQMSNDSYRPEDRSGAAIEIRGIRQQLLGIANTEVAGRHLFAGRRSDTSPFSDAGAYLGAEQPLEAKIGYEQWLPTGFDGSEVFQGAVDTFATLDALATALESDDIAAVRASLDGIGAGLGQLIRSREEVGFHQSIADDTLDLTRSMKMVLDSHLAETIEADPAAAYSALATQQTNYQATLQVLGSQRSTNLFSFIQ